MEVLDGRHQAAAEGKVLSPIKGGRKPADYDLW